jgi:hypothetical protein
MSPHPIDVDARSVLTDLPRSQEARIQSIAEE